MNTSIQRYNDNRTIQPYDFTDMETGLQVAVHLSKMHEICPKECLNRPYDVFGRILYGKSLGLNPMESLKSIYFLNGKPSVYGDALLAICRRSPVFESIQETFDQKTNTAICTVKRRGEEPCVVTFSEQQAKAAKLWGKAGPWTQYPERMLKMRARSWALRDTFSDALGGLVGYEEVIDIQQSTTSHGHYVTSQKDVDLKNTPNVILEHLQSLRREIEEVTPEQLLAEEKLERDWALRNKVPDDSGEILNEIELSPIITEDFNLDQFSITDNTYKLLEDLIIKNDMDTETINKWITRASEKRGGVEGLSDLTEEEGQKILDHYKILDSKKYWSTVLEKKD